MTPVLVALISLCTALLVAVFSHLLTNRRKQRDELAEMRLLAYTEFIGAASRLVSSRRVGMKRDDLDDLARLNDAKTRICLCAPAKVIRALAEFWEQGGTLEKEGEVLAFTRLCELIRADLGNAVGDLSGFDLSHTLFKLEPSSFSFRADVKVPSLAELERDAHTLRHDA